MDLDEVNDLSREFENLTHKGVKFAYDSKHLFFCSDKNKLAKYNVSSHQVCRRFTLPPDCKPITCFALESSDTYIFIVTASCEIIVYDIQDKVKNDAQLIFFTSFDDSIIVKNIYLSNDDKRAIMTDTDDHFSYVSLSNLEQPEILEQQIDPKISNIVGVTFSQKNSQVFITSQEMESIILYDLLLKM